jgi:hypothetical protein
MEAGEARHSLVMRRLEAEKHLYVTAVGVRCFITVLRVCTASAPVMPAGCWQEGEVNEACCFVHMRDGPSTPAAAPFNPSSATHSFTPPHSLHHTSHSHISSLSHSPQSHCQAGRFKAKNQAFIRHCLLPRLTRSVADAVFCHHFTLRMHLLDVPNWPAGFFWDEVRLWVAVCVAVCLARGLSQCCRSLVQAAGHVWR